MRRVFMWLRVGVLLLLGFLSASCRVDDQVSEDVGVNSCDALSETPSTALGETVVADVDPPCSLEFVDVATLTGKLGGPLPKPPVARGLNGGWITATYDPGKVATWSASGGLQVSAGIGDGQGPGEFSEVTDLVVDSARDRLYIISSAPRLEVYSLSGDFLETVPLPGIPSRGALLEDGTVVTNVMPAGAGPALLRVRGRSADRVGPAKRGAGLAPSVRAGTGGVWLSEAAWYYISHYSIVEGRVDRSIHRDVAWFPAPTAEDIRMGYGPQLVSFGVDRRASVVMVLVQQVEDPNAPGGDMPRPRNPEEGRRLFGAYFDAVIEALSMDGRLLATRRFDEWSEAPLPVRGSENFWYRLGDEPSRPIRILRPVLSGAR